MKNSFRRSLRAQLRDLWVLMGESKNALLSFCVIVVGSALVFHFFYTYPGTHEHPDLSLSLYAAFSLIFFERVLPYPDTWFFQILYFVIPIFGLIAVADGVLLFGNALLSKQARGQKWQVAMASTYNNHIIVCGTGKIGYRVILELIKFDQNMVAIEINPEGRFVEAVQGMGVPLLFEDATRPESLLKAGVKEASAIVPCTDDELKNLDIALDAREINPGIKVVMRMFDPDLARRVEKGFGIHTAFSTSALAAPIFASAAMLVDVKHSFYVGDTLLVISEMTVKESSELSGMRVKDLEESFDLSVICVEVAGGAKLHPGQDHILAAESDLLLLSSIENLRKVEKLNQ